MRHGLLLLVAAFVLIAGMVYVFAQDRPPEGPERPFGPRPGQDRERGERPQRLMRPPMMPGGAAAMELSGNMLFLVSGTKVYKINTSEMKLEAQRDLSEAGGSDDSAADMVIKKLDKDGDGLISKDEWPGPPQMFDKMDSNGDGFIAKEEIPEELLDRARKLGRKLPTGGPAAIKVATTSLYVYLGGTLYKLKISDLEIEGSLDIDKDQGRTPGMDRKRDRKRDKGDRGDRPKKKKKGDNDDDFGF